ncbi:MAG: protease [Gemmatimonadetes bacterium]|nr:MAG: protease [Gemmatimonadota bacterium]
MRGAARWSHGTGLAVVGASATLVPFRRFPLRRSHVRTHTVSLLLVLCGASLGVSQSGAPPLLLRRPAISATQLVFTYGGNLWIVSRDGGDARRLTAGPGTENGAAFSPDGNWVAFTGAYDGNPDVFVVAAAGGVPKRLTYHPGLDDVVGWTPDGKSVLFLSTRSSYYHFAPKLYAVPLEGGFPTEYPLPIVAAGSLSPDGSHIAYVPHPQWQRAWKRYRGGQTTPIWLADLKDAHIEKVPRDNSNDFNPMWVGGTVYFLSDRNGAVSLFAYDSKSKQVSEVVKNDGLDFKSASAGPGAIVIEQIGALKLYDLKTQQTRTLDVRVAGDLPQVRPHFVKVDPKRVRNFGISPTGKRAVMEAWGEIFTVPSDKGDIRNLTRTPTVAERDPAWSPDGKWVAYFSEASGEYNLEIRDQSGLGDAKKINLGNPPSFFYSPVWSPDGQKIAYSDKRLNVWYVDVAKGAPIKVDADYYEGAYFNLRWAPDSRWLVYTKQLPSFLHAVWVYSLEQGKAFQLTDGMSDALYATFDRSGKYLYFTASTDVGPSAEGFDMSSNNRPQTRSVYAVVLAKDQGSPLAPESDEEKGNEPKQDEKDKPKKEEPPPVVRIDFEGISQRIVALPIPARNYLNMVPGKSGILFISEGPRVITEADFPNLSQTLYKWDLEKRKLDKFVDEINDFAVSFNGEKLLYRKGEQWVMAGTEEPPASGGKPKPGEGPLKLDSLLVYVQPREMWRQQYRETWRIERDFFYDPNHHGLDLDKVAAKYQPYLDGLASRDELTYLSGLQAPLTQPGVNIKAGDYLLAVNGRQLRSADNLYSFFEETAGKQVILKVGPSPDGTGARDVTVVPVESEENLRRFAWIEGNRRKVSEMTGGRVGYVYLPNTAGAGYNNFNRYYFAQVGKEAVIIDERFNEGGQLADWVVDFLHRPLMSKITTREGADWSSPSASIYGPKVMIVNEMAGSGGDALPWYFRKAGVGPLVGKQTWGGLVGIGGYPELIDGGNVMAPRFALYGLNGEWEVENHGILPDYDVDLDPAAVRQGHDPQLEKAVDVVLQLLKQHPAPQVKRPPYPNYHRQDGLGVKETVASQ